MTQTLVGAFLVAHGLISTSIGNSSVADPNGAPMAMPLGSVALIVLLWGRLTPAGS
jgi:uncharacterized membrane protein YhhN